MQFGHSINEIYSFIGEVPPYVPAAVLTGESILSCFAYISFWLHAQVVVAILSDRLKMRGPFILICLPLAIIGKDLSCRDDVTIRQYEVFIFFDRLYYGYNRNYKHCSICSCILHGCWSVRCSPLQVLLHLNFSCPQLSFSSMYFVSSISDRISRRC